MASFSMYHPETIRQFQGNPFIEALPPRASDAEIILQLQHRPEYDPADRLKPAEDRTMLVQILVYRIGRYCLRSTVLKSARFIWNQSGKRISLTGISAITSIPPPMNLAIPNHVTTSSILRWSIKTGKISCRWRWISVSCFVSHIMASILECEFGKHCSLICFQFITIGFVPS